MERSVEILAVVQFFIVGFSHALRPHAWIDFFIRLHQRGHAGVFAHGFLSLGMGSLILGFHNVWTGIPALLTVIGYLYTFKATMCFVFPETQMLTLGRVSHERPREFVVVGIVCIIVACVLSYSIWFT